MPRSEIDDIFATKTKQRNAQPVASSSSSTATVPKKQRDKKRKRQAEDEDVAEENPRKRPEPVTILDPSTTVAARKPEVEISSKTVRAKIGRKNRKGLAEFADSRGSGSRRRTEEGFAIYKEAELGIDVEAGETPLCPFDCECCF